MQHNGDGACGPLMKACSICSVMTRVSVATFPEKSQAAHIKAFNKAFNATDSLFNSLVCEAAYCFFQSLLTLWVNGYYGRTNKEKIDDCRRWNMKLMWSPKTHLPIIDCCFRCWERQRNENHQDENFKYSYFKRKFCFLQPCSYFGIFDHTRSVLTLNTASYSFITVNGHAVTIWRHSFTAEFKGQL